MCVRDIVCCVKVIGHRPGGTQRALTPNTTVTGNRDAVDLWEMWKPMVTALSRSLDSVLPKITELHLKSIGLLIFLISLTPKSIK